MGKTFATFLNVVMLCTTASAAEPVNTIDNCSKAAELWKAAYNNKDAAALANMYHQKGMYATESWTAKGHDALLARFKQEVSAGGQVTSITCNQSNQVGNINYASGTFTGTGKGSDGKDATVSGDWMTVSEVQGKKFIILTHKSNVKMTP
jgi:ketosteroid isomerase-like protein